MALQDPAWLVAASGAPLDLATTQVVRAAAGAAAAELVAELTVAHPNKWVRRAKLRNLDEVEDVLILGGPLGIDWATAIEASEADATHYVVLEIVPAGAMGFVNVYGDTALAVLAGGGAPAFHAIVSDEGRAR